MDPINILLGFGMMACSLIWLWLLTKVPDYGGVTFVLKGLAFVPIVLGLFFGFLSIVLGLG